METKALSETLKEEAMVKQSIGAYGDHRRSYRAEPYAASVRLSGESVYVVPYSQMCSFCRFVSKVAVSSALVMGLSLIHI